jgi:Arc-like DNA binding domain
MGMWSYDRWGVAMTATLAAVAGLIVGLMLGATIAGLALTERWPGHWVVYLRLPEDLHHRLKEAARDHMWDLKAEIINRLQASFKSGSLWLRADRLG